MKEYNLKMDSWHRWVANFGDRRVGSSTDICAYTRAFLVGSFWLFVVGCLASAGIGFVGIVLWNIIDMIFNGAGILPPTVVTFGVILTLGVLFIFMSTKEIIQERRWEQEKADIAAGIVREPGFVALAYRKFKDKTCFKIKFD